MNHRTDGQTATAARVLGALSAALGAALLLRPAAVTRMVSGRGDAPSDVVARVLGGRQLLQGLALITRPEPPVVTVAVATDVLHAASMLLLGWIRPVYRRPAVVSAAVAASSAGCGGMILCGIQ